MDLYGVADSYLELRDKKDELETELKRIKQEMEKAEQQLIDSMIDGELDNFKRNGNQYILVNKIFVSPEPEAKEELYKRMKQRGYEHLFTINSQTLNAELKRLVEDSQEHIPEWLDGLVKQYDKTTISLRRTK